MTALAPEQLELNKKLAVLERLKDRLAVREEQMAELRGVLERFEARYTMEVGRLYAEQDEIDAQIAEEEVKLVPDDEEIKKKAEELRRRAEESAAKAAAEREDTEWVPTPAAKKAYHELARVIHPDLALDAGEKERRHGLMADLNAAYSSGDQRELDRMVQSFRNSPDLIAGDSLGDQLVRAIRQIAQIKSRFRELADEMLEARCSELYELSERVQAEMELGRDLLKQMAERAKTHILKSQRRLENLRTVNLSAEEYVKETFGMNIADFRERPVS